MKWKRYDISEPYVIATKTPCTAIYIQTGCCSDGTLQCSGNTDNGPMNRLHGSVIDIPKLQEMFAYEKDSFLKRERNFV